MRNQGAHENVLDFGVGCVGVHVGIIGILVQAVLRSWVERRAWQQAALMAQFCLALVKMPRLETVKVHVVDSRLTALTFLGTRRDEDNGSEQNDYQLMSYDMFRQWSVEQGNSVDTTRDIWCATLVGSSVVAFDGCGCVVEIVEESLAEPPQLGPDYVIEVDDSQPQDDQPLEPLHALASHDVHSSQSQAQEQEDVPAMMYQSQAQEPEEVPSQSQFEVPRVESQLASVTLPTQPELDTQTPGSGGSASDGRSLKRTHHHLQ